MATEITYGVGRLGALELLVVALAIIILIAVAIALFRIVKSSPGWVLWLIMLLGGGGFLVIVLMLGALLFYSQASVPTVSGVRQHKSDAADGPREEVFRSARTAPISAQRRPITDDEDPDSFVADLYPGVVQCGAPMAYLISDAITEILQKKELSDVLPEAEASDEVTAEKPEQKTIVRIELKNENLSKQDYADVTRRFKKQMKKLMPDLEFVDEAAEGSDDEKIQSFKLTFRSIDTSLGKLIGEISTADITRRYGVDFIPKLWLTDLAKWKSFNRGRQYIIGRCESFEASPEEARSKAILDAKQQLETLWPGVTNRNGPDDPKFYDHVDSFPQKYSRSYGDVFRQSVLFELRNVSINGQTWGTGGRVAAMPADSRATISGTPITTAEAAREAIEGRAAAEAIPRNRRHRSSLSLEWFVAMLVVATVVLGTLSNVFTQGYYRSEISASVIGLLFLGVAALIFLLVGS